MNEDNNKRNVDVFSKFSAKSNFFMGFSASVIVFFVVGFFVLLGITLRNDSGVSGDAQPAIAAPAPSQGAQGDISFVPVTDEDWVRGSKNAKVSIVEYSDTECPFCKRFHPTMKKVIDEYGDSVNWVYRHFPLSTLHRKAQKEAEATECAGDLGGNDGFWAYLDRLFEITPSNDGLDESQLPQIAQDVGLNRSQFEACLDSGKYAQKVKNQYEQAIAAGGRGTPYSVVITADGKTIPVSGAVPYEQLKSVIDSAL